MSLLRDTSIKKQSGLLDQSDPKKETKHEKKISKRVKKQKDEFKSIGDMIQHVQNKVLKSDGGEIAIKKRLQKNIDSSIKHKHTTCQDCKNVLVPVWDEKKSTKSHIIWTNLLKCINCGETYEKEEPK